MIGRWYRIVTFLKCRNFLGILFYCKKHGGLTRGRLSSNLKTSGQSRNRALDRGFTEAISVYLVVQAAEARGGIISDPRSTTGTFHTRWASHVVDKMVHYKGIPKPGVARINPATTPFSQKIIRTENKIIEQELFCLESKAVAYLFVQEPQGPRRVIRWTRLTSLGGVWAHRRAVPAS